jgi:non-ribosomal peptide synthetase component F
MQATPATWKMLLLSEWNGDMNLKALCGGEALTKDLARELLSKCGELWNMYGPTETTIWSTVKRVKEEDIQLNLEIPVSIGKPIANTQVYILNRNLNLQPIGVFGELYIGGKGVAKGYHNNSELTRERFIENPFDNNSRLYKTGDYARMLPNGELEYIGRLDNQVKIRGYRIELGEIECDINT